MNSDQKKALHAFASGANWQCLHPSDIERWNQFIQLAKIEPYAIADGEVYGFLKGRPNSFSIPCPDDVAEKMENKCRRRKFGRLKRFCCDICEAFKGLFSCSNASFLRIFNISNIIALAVITIITLAIVFVVRKSWTESSGVQLWEGGPYWAECNVGATKPEEVGYYFWWGDTVGYKRNADVDGWVSVKDGSACAFDDCPTMQKDNSQLKSDGYINWTGNLAAAHDAATTYLGAPWRMPTDNEFDELISNCDAEWTMRNGVCGRLVKGRGTYSSKSIFFPVVAGRSLSGRYWSSTPHSGDFRSAWYLYFNSDGFCRDDYFRCSGYVVRPVRGVAQ